MKPQPPVTRTVPRSDRSDAALTSMTQRSQTGEPSTEAHVPSRTDRYGPSRTVASCWSRNSCIERGRDVDTYHGSTTSNPERSPAITCSLLRSFSEREGMSERTGGEPVNHVTP